MKTLLYRLVLPALFASLASAQAPAGLDWPGFLGPGASATAAQDIPLEWSAEKNMLWKADLPGPGNSSPVVAKGKVLLTAYTGYGIDKEKPGDINQLARHLLCFDAESGEELWRSTVEAAQPEDKFKGYITEHGYASNTPATDGERVYVFFGKTGLLAYDFEGGELWRAPVGKQSNNNKWGSASPPVLHGDLVIVNASDEALALCAFNRATGEEVWRRKSPAMKVVYAIPRLIEIEGRTDLVLRVSGEIWGLDPATGETRWSAKHDYPGTTTALVQHDQGMLYTFGGFPKRATVALKLGGGGDITEQVAWTSERTPGTPTPILHNGVLHWVENGGFAVGISTKDGERVYKERLGGKGGKFYASPLRVGDHILALTRRNGAFVYTPGPDFKVVAHNTIEGDDSEFGATPAVAGGRVYLRSWKALYCIGGK